MHRYFAVITVILLIILVLSRVMLMKKQGIKAVRFGEMDKKDYIIPPFAMLFFYLVFASAFHWPILGSELFNSIIAGWIGVALCLLGEKGKNHKLMAQISRDYENSSIPSSMKPRHKKISNSREKTGRKPGGQRGHEGHRRKRLTPTDRIHIPEPEKYKSSPDYRPTGREITKQMIGLHVSVSVAEYYTKEFRNVKTGQRVHAEFPAGVRDEVNYAGSVRAFAFLLNSRCCVSIDKVLSLIHI